MNRVVMVLVALISFGFAGWAADAVDDMVTLAQRGIGDEVLLAKAETSAMPALTTQDILRLKEGRVSDRVIATMIRRGTTAQAPSRVDYTANKYSAEASDPVIGTPEPLAANVAPQRVIEVQRAAPVVYGTYDTAPVVYSTPVVYSSPIVYAGYSYPRYYGGYYGGYYGRPCYSGYYGSSYCGPRYYGGGSYYGGGYYGHSHYRSGGSFGFRAGFRF